MKADDNQQRQRHRRRRRRHHRLSLSLFCVFTAVILSFPTLVILRSRSVLRQINRKEEERQQDYDDDKQIVHHHHHKRQRRRRPERLGIGTRRQSERSEESFVRQEQQHKENTSAPTVAPIQQFQPTDRQSRHDHNNNNSSRSRSSWNIHPMKSGTTKMKAIEPTTTPTSWGRLEDELRSQNIRFYFYDDDDIKQPRIIENLVLNRGSGRLKDRFRPETLVEHYILTVLEQHPLRTRNASEAQVFIISTRIGGNVIHRGTLIPALVEALTSKPTWNNGHRHVLLALNGQTFAYEHRKDVARHGLTRDVYQILSNVTVVHAYDEFACANLSSRGLGGDYRELFAESRYSVSNSGFSIGLLPEPNLTYIPATWNKFQRSRLFLFYRTRPSSSFYNSTPYRHAPLGIVDQLPQPSSVGTDLPADEWLQDFVNSKFCLAGRGDTPHTHALLRAVKVGCIPVVVSDWYPVYAPTLSRTLDMREFSVFLEERRFLDDPLRELQSLQDLPNEIVQQKLEALAFAQQVVAWDHPRSLFVESFLREAVHTFREDPNPWNYFSPLASGETSRPW